ncbi:MAG: AraC family transcriptional regulator [Clostridiales bacterium]|nr:AraC family transcriptional regulator [Clostridiales bacterium]
MSYFIYEKFTYSTSHLHTIFHDLWLTSELSSKAKMHWHESLELIYVLEGICSIDSDTSCIYVHPGELAIIPCNENHRVQSQTSLSHYYCLIINPLDCAHLPFSLESTSFEPITKNSFALELFLKITDELSSHPMYYQFTVKSLITHLIIELYRLHTATPQTFLTSSTHKDPKMLLVQKAIFYIRTHFTENLSLEELCLHIGVSKYYLCRIFKEVTGKTIIQFMNELKCQYAQKLIYEGNYTVNQISEMSGFNSLPYFYRIYKKYIGTTPSASK